MFKTRDVICVIRAKVLELVVKSYRVDFKPVRESLGKHQLHFWGEVKDATSVGSGALREKYD
jgi:alpha/beta superfamily hydrolase